MPAAITGSPRVRVVVLAAGAGSRFGGRKLEARLAGRPILQHALDALAAAGHDDPIVVLAPESGLEPVIAWRRAQRVVNPDPAHGLAGSLQLGWAAALAADPAPDAVLIALGDQPRLRPEVVRTIAAAPLDPAHPIVVPRYPDSDARNPVRIEATAAGARLVDAATGDRGLGPLLTAAPGLVRWLDVPGDNPDVDERRDLIAAIEADWAERVRRNRLQVDRIRESAIDDDHYAPVADLFRDDPRRRGDGVLDALLRIAAPADTWLDVGAGAGRYAFPLALAAREVIAVDPSPAMVAALEEGVRVEHLANVRVLAGRWPDAAGALVPLPCADVALIANVGHDTEAIGLFIDALEAATRRACVAVMQERPPASIAAPFFEAVHGEPRAPLPALIDFVDLLTARGSSPAIEILERPARAWQSRDEVLTFLRRQTWVRPGSPADRRLQEVLDDRLRPAPVTPETAQTPETPETPSAAGGLTLGPSEPTRIGVVRWSP